MCGIKWLNNIIILHYRIKSQHIYETPENDRIIRSVSGPFEHSLVVFIGCLHFHNLCHLILTDMCTLTNVYCKYCCSNVGGRFVSRFSTHLQYEPRELNVSIGMLRLHGLYGLFGYVSYCMSFLNYTYLFVLHILFLFRYVYIYMYGERSCERSVVVILDVCLFQSPT